MARHMRVSTGSAVITVLGVLLFGLPAFAQGSSPEATTSRGSKLEDTVQSLVEEVKELDATVLELRAEVARSREETRELRGELQRAIGGPALALASAPDPAKSVSVEPEAQAETLPSVPAATSQQNSESRLTQLEEGVELLKAKVDEQYQTKVESASKYRMKLGGIVLINLFGNSGAVDSQEVPNVALPPGLLSTSGSVAGTIRQSQLSFEAYGPALAGAKTSGALSLDFFGEYPDVSNGSTWGAVHLRTGIVRLDWARTSLVAGQDAPFFSPLSPTSFASLAYPALSYAGNLWTWTPQLRVEHRISLSDKDTLHLEAGILDPLSGQPPSEEDYGKPQAGEASRQPAYGSHIAWSRGASANGFSLGIGGYYSRQNYGGGRTVDAWAGTADWNLPMGPRFAFSGEFYRGRALGGLGAAEGRSVFFGGPIDDPTSEVNGLNTMGGWGQFKFKASSSVEFNAAYGQDSPFSADLHYFNVPVSYVYSSIAKNQAEMFNIIYRPRTDLLFALEYRHLNTMQIANPRNVAGQVNLSMGLLF